MADSIGPIQAFVHVGADGMLSLKLPLNVTNVDFEVTVNLKQVNASTDQPGVISDEEMRRADWRRFVMESYGAIDDPTFFRHEQGELETREEFP